MIRNIVSLFGCFLVYTVAGTIQVIGDSHTRCFSNIENCMVHWLGPRTMYRCGRDGLSLVNLKHLGVIEGDMVIFIFGEIDVRCHIGKQRDMRQVDLNEIIIPLVENYCKAIVDHQRQYHRIHCAIQTILPPAPFAPENSDYPCYGSLEDRINITRQLNNVLVEYCDKYHISVIDVYQNYVTDEGILKYELSDGSVHINSYSVEPIKKALAILQNNILLHNSEGAAWNIIV